MSSVTDMLETIRRNGFVVVPGFFDTDLVDRARQEIVSAYQGADGVARASDGAVRMREPAHDLLLDLPGRSKAFDSMFEKLLTDETSRSLLDGIAGDFRIRDVNCRVMTGDDTDDLFNPPHEWHRDTPGEICIGFFLTDVEQRGNAATALVSGSHLAPIDPRYDALWGRPFYSRGVKGKGIGALTRLNPFGRRLAAEKLGHATGAYGRRGDFYVFINDTWHGREANLHGGRAMIVLAGGFASGFAHGAGWKERGAARMSRVPPHLRDRLEERSQRPTSGETIIDWMFRHRTERRIGDSYWLAKLERRIMNRVSHVLEMPLAPARRLLQNESVRGLAKRALAPRRTST